jgi:sulfur-oxidizing protein SoxY
LVGASRRHILAGLGGGAVAALLPVPLSATPESMRAAMREVLGDRPVAEGGVAIDLTILSETGNSVPITVAWEGAGRCTSLHLFSEGNPRPRIASYRFGPASGPPKIRMRIRLARSQMIHAVAETEDGRLFGAATHITVTQGACADDIWLSE